MLSKVRYHTVLLCSFRPQLFLVQASGGKRKLLHVPKYDKWDDVFLEYHVDWPLHLLLTPQVHLQNLHS